MNKKESEKSTDRPSWKMPENDEYLGNIWGWKLSFYGLALIVALGSLMAYRHYQIGDWSMVKAPETETVIDSLSND